MNNERQQDSKLEEKPEFDFDELKEERWKGEEESDREEGELKEEEREEWSLMRLGQLLLIMWSNMDYSFLNFWKTHFLKPFTLFSKL